MRDLAKRVVDHCERHALAWDNDRQNSPWNDRSWHDRFMELLPKRATVLDLGCGGGRPVAEHLAKAGFKVVGVGSSPAMISLSRSRLPDHEWMVADMRSLSVARRFDGLLAWDSYFHLSYDDQKQMFDVFKAHASSHATLMFNTGSRFGEAIGNYRGDPLYHASLDAMEYEALIAQAGFEVIEHAVNAPGGRSYYLANPIARVCILDKPSRLALVAVAGEE
jgi:trans-aconitate methyltransferase